MRLFVSFFLIACLFLTTPVKAEEEVDPFEKSNRGIYAFNKVLDDAFIRPLAVTYRFLIPRYGRERVSSFFSNLNEPITFFNALLQFDVERSFTSFWRFTINSTFGLGGIFDIATLAGLEHRKEDFGQTLGVYRFDAGPYVVLPILGPSSGRDTIGLVADVFLDPFNYIFHRYASIGLAAGEGVEKRESVLDVIDDIESNSIDPYATIRSLYLQQRESLIKNEQ